MRFDHDDAFEFLGAKTTGLAIEFPDLGGEDYAQVSLYLVEGGTAEWVATGWQVGAGHTAVGTSGTTIGPNQTGFLLVAVQSEEPQPLRVWKWNAPEPERPEVQATGRWHVSGPASISYYLFDGQSSPTFEVSHGFQIDRPPVSPHTGTMAGELGLATRHDGPGPKMVASFSHVISDSATGEYTVTWSSNGSEVRKSTPFVQAALVKLIPGHAIQGPDSGPSSLRVDLNGALARGRGQFTHTSLSLDLNALGLDGEMTFQANSLTGASTVMRGCWIDNSGTCSRP